MTLQIRQRLEAHLSKNASVCIPFVQFLDGSLEVGVVQRLVVLILEGVLNDSSRQNIGTFCSHALQLIVGLNLR